MAYNVIGAVIYTPSISTVIKNGSAVTIIADMTSYKLIDDYGNGGSVYFPSTSDSHTQFGGEITVKCFSGSNGGGSVLSTLSPTLVRVSSQKASITFTPPIGTRSIRIETSLYTLVGSETYDYTNFGGYVGWGSPNTYDTGVYYWAAKESYTRCDAPTSISVASNNVAANASVRLSWSGAKAGIGVAIKGYDIYRSTSATGTYTKITTVTTTATSSSVNVTAPSDNGSYYYKVVTLSSVAGYDSPQSSTYATLTCKITACEAPTSLSLAVTSSTGSSVRLSWRGANAGTNNSISGYEIQRRESADGSSWGSWSSLGVTASTYTNVAPPTTAGNYYQYQVRTLGSAGASYNSGWRISSNTLRRSYTACGAPTSCVIDSTLSLVATVLRWSGATAGYGNTISKYEVQRRSKAPGGSWSAWSAFEITSGTSLSVSPPATAGYYYQYRVRAQGTAGEAYYSGWKESTNTLRKAHRSIPAFTDPTLIVGQTDVKAVHITELQNIMNDILLPFMGVSTVLFTKLERDSDAKHWGAHVQEIKSAIDSTGSSHESWVAMQDEVTADVIEQLRRIVKSM